MPLPQVIVRRGDRGAAPIAADDISTYFDVVAADRGPLGTAVECRSMGQVRQAFGEHSTTSTLRAVESYFAEGGSRAVLTRVLGPSATHASLDLRDTGGNVVLRIRAVEIGSLGNSILTTTDAFANDTRRIEIAFRDETLVSGVCASAQEAVELIARSGVATAEIGSGTWPFVALDERALRNGTSDVANVTGTEISRALVAFEEDLGAGTVCASGFSTIDAHRALADHAAAFNRFARGDLTETSTRDLRTHAQSLRDYPNGRYLQLLAGRPTILVGGVEIDVPASGVLCGREARADRENGPGPGQPCAQSFGEFATAVGVAHRWSKADREALNDAGVTVIVQDPRGAIFAEDAITVVEPSRYPQYAEVVAMRVTMAVHAQAKQALSKRLMQTIDGKGHLAGAATGDLAAICSGWYGRNALYGEDASQAFTVSVAAETPAGGRPRLVGYLSLRPSPSAHTIDLTITQVAPGDTI